MNSTDMRSALALIRLLKQLGINERVCSAASQKILFQHFNGSFTGTMPTFPGPYSWHNQIKQNERTISLLLIVDIVVNIILSIFKLIFFLCITVAAWTLTIFMFKYIFENLP